jgi:hypothetical protein
MDTRGIDSEGSVARAEEEDASIYIFGGWSLVSVVYYRGNDRGKGGSQAIFICASTTRWQGREREKRRWRRKGGGGGTICAIRSENET